MDLENKKKTDEYLLVEKQDLLDIIATLKPKSIWINSLEVKEILRIKSDTTLQSLRNKNVFDIMRISSKLLLYRRSSVLDFLEKNSDKAS